MRGCRVFCGESACVRAIESDQAGWLVACSPGETRSLSPDLEPARSPNHTHNQRNAAPPYYSQSMTIQPDAARASAPRGGAAPGQAAAGDSRAASPAPPPASDDASSSDDDGASDRDPQHQQQNDREWDDWGDDDNDGDGANSGASSGDGDDSDRTRALFDPPGAAPWLPSPEAAMARDAQEHGFDLKAWRRRCGLDQYGVIRAVNWARRCVARGEDPRPALRAYEEAAVLAAASGGGAPPPAPPAWAGDEFLVPALPGDPLVTYDYEEEDDDGEEKEERGQAAAAAAAPAAAAKPAAKAKEPEPEEDMGFSLFD